LAALPVPSTSSVTELAAFVRRMRCTYKEKNKNKQKFVFRSDSSHYVLFTLRYTFIY
jgi:hypothetical protein